jgi:predicted nucleic acid-binding protein
VKAVIDTNVVVDYLRGIDAARVELARYERPAISVLTWMEVLAGSGDTTEMAVLQRFLRRFDVIPVDALVAGEAVELRREHRLRPPDAIVWATARARDALFVTRNTRDFPGDDPGVRVPYRI